jgi:hypothetical protein
MFIDFSKKYHVWNIDGRVCVMSTDDFNAANQRADELALYYRKEYTVLTRGVIKTPVVNIEEVE